MKPRLRIVRTSGREAANLLPERLTELATAGFPVLYEDLEPDPTWAYAAATAPARAKALENALCEAASDIVLCARGGYGASDLLPLLDWRRLAATPAKLLVGFSDVSALHAAFYAKLDWPGLHAPMPATELWGKNAERRDLDTLFALLAAWQQRRDVTGAVDVTPIAAKGSPPSAQHPAISGRLFGGCFTVLTNLLATPYFPDSLAGHILFIEDTGEHPARLMRSLNQWLQSGTLDQVQALIIGSLRGMSDKIEDSAPFVLAEFAARLPLPVFHSPLFGHTSPNLPLMIGAHASIEGTRLTWQIRRDEPVSIS